MWECIDGVPIERFIAIVREHIGQDWKRLARCFKFTKTDIDAIQHDNMGNLVEQIAQLFIRWRSQNGPVATAQALVDAVIEENLKEVLNALKTERLIQRKGLNSFQGSPQSPIQGSQPVTVQEYAPGPIQESRPITVQGPVQESPPQLGPCKPKLLGFAAAGGSGLDVEVDWAERGSMVVKTSTSSLKNSPLSPEELKKEIRIKRLVRRESDKTGRGPFEENSMVYVEGYGCGLVKCIKDFPKEGLMAGIQFEEPIEGSAEFEGVSFDCEEGCGRFVLYSQLEEDNRFEQGQVTPSKADEDQESCAVKDDVSPQTLPTEPIASLGQRLERVLDILNDTSDSVSVCKLTGCSRPRHASEDGKVYDCCCRSHAAIHTRGTCAGWSSDVSERPASSSQTFLIREDCVGMVIGREGKNISKVERDTNTSIRIKNNIGVITGSQENCRKAALMIAAMLERKISMHTATSKTIVVPDNMVRRIIGRSGITIETIKSLSGVQDIEFSKKPTGLEALLNFNRTCTISGSEEQIEKAKELIKRVENGEDIVTNAQIAAMCGRLGVSLNDDNDACVIS